MQPRRVAGAFFIGVVSWLREKEGSLSQMHIVVAGAVGNDGRIEHLATAHAFPGVEGADDVIEFFRVHSSFALGAFHRLSPP